MSRKIWSIHGANTRYWGMSNGFNTAKVTIVNYSNKGKSKNYDLKLYLPCDEHPNIERQAGRAWKYKLGNLEFCEGVRNGLFDGSVEVLVLEGEFAAVSYHLAMLDISPVHITLGFFTKDQKLISKIVSVVNEFLSDSVSHDKPNLIGKLIC